MRMRDCCGPGKARELADVERGWAKRFGRLVVAVSDGRMIVDIKITEKID